MTRAPALRDQGGVDHEQWTKLHQEGWAMKGLVDGKSTIGREDKTAFADMIRGTVNRRASSADEQRLLTKSECGKICKPQDYAMSNNPFPNCFVHIEFTSSPDLAPSDFHLFGLLKRHLGGMAFETEDNLISELRNWFEILTLISFEWVSIRCCRASKNALISTGITLRSSERVNFNLCEFQIYLIKTL
ncbi:hypothetical protein PoB_003149400 [Plakobranchus ocellatus]|uniref:Uncharacterized protein n=1 Tax=Plakobranchus ocellatus TaxID=259542 RepID=A0AAV4AEY4_9GAST|nr:hypothetical protein PoB_003149400 [Plakobranchus ocellatus]